MPPAVERGQGRGIGALCTQRYAGRLRRWCRPWQDAHHRRFELDSTRDWAQFGGLRHARLRHRSRPLVAGALVLLSALCGGCVLPDVSAIGKDAGGSENAVGAGGTGSADAGVVRADAPPTAAPVAGTAGRLADAGNGGQVAAGNGGQGAAGSRAQAAEPTLSCASDNGGGDTSPMANCITHAGAGRGCQCPKGYSGDGVGADGCQKDDECAEDNGGCGSPTYFTCTNNTGAPPTCKDIDECAKDNGGCSTVPMATCTNRMGAAPSCACPSGFMGSGVGSGGCTLATFTSGKFSYDAMTVKDTSTGLTWQRVLPAAYAGCTGRYSTSGSVGEACNWEGAKTYCTQLALAGGGWRLPTKDELVSIADTGRTNPAIDTTAFPNTPGEWFWSSSPYVGPSGGAWSVNFYFVNGFSDNFATGNAYRVRCVR